MIRVFFACILILFFITSRSQEVNRVNEYLLAMDDISNLVIKVTSNVNEFTCRLNSTSPGDTIDLNLEWEESQVKFNDAEIFFPVEGFNCNHQAMTTDFRETLNAESYPFLQLSVEKVFINPDFPEVPTVQAEVTFTISGVSVRKSIVFTQINLEGNLLSFRGEKKIMMTEFGLLPPKALFGLIQVNDALEVEFDLAFRLFNKKADRLRSAF